MNFKQQNPLERETEQILKSKEAITDLNNIRKIMLLSNKKQFNEIRLTINQIIKHQDKIYHPENLKYQIEFLKIFYHKINNLEAQDGKYMDINGVSNYKLRLLQLNVNMKIKSGKILTNEEVDELVNLVKSNPSLKEQTMMKTVGCRSIKTMMRISKQQIDDLTQDLYKVAIKYQIASDWKYIIGDNKQSLALKEQSFKIWQKLNRPNRSLDTKQQLQHLKKLCKGKKVETNYGNKLKNMQMIVKKLQEVPDLTDKQQLQNRKGKASIKLLLGRFVQQLQLNEKQQKKNINNSTIYKKQGLIQQRKQIGEEFLKQLKKNNFTYCNFVYNSRFEEGRVLELEKIFGILNKIGKKISRQFFNEVQKIGKKSN